MPEAVAPGVRMIPQADPGAAYRASRPAIDAAVARVLASGNYVLGAENAAFEAEFGAWLGGVRAVGCASGTDALALALRALGVGPGDRVATVSHTAVATVAAIGMTGASPVLLDVEEGFYTLCPRELEAVLAAPQAGAPVKAVVVVHLYGQPADLDEILAVADRHGAPVIEDCAQAHGALHRGRPVGGWGAAGAFSFYPTKNLGGFGDGGAVTTTDTALADRVAALRQYGWDAGRISRAAGVNSRLDELQAAILRARLVRLDQDNARRQAIAARYDGTLRRLGHAPPPRRPDGVHVFHQYVIRHADRDAARARLAAAGVGTAVHYPVPAHRHPAWRGRACLGPSGCRASERIAGEILSLPMHAHLDDAAVDQVCEALRHL